MIIVNIPIVDKDILVKWTQTRRLKPEWSRLNRGTKDGSKTPSFTSQLGFHDDRTRPQTAAAAHYSLLISTIPFVASETHKVIIPSSTDNFISDLKSPIVRKVKTHELICKITMELIRTAVTDQTGEWI